MIVSTSMTRPLHCTLSQIAFFLPYDAEISVSHLLPCSVRVSGGQAILPYDVNRIGKTARIQADRLPAVGDLNAR